MTEVSNFDELRREVRDFVAAEIAAGRWRPICDCWLGGFDPEFSRRVGERGWIGMTFPRAYGGSEAGGLARFAVVEELLAAGAPVAAHWLADRQIGPALLRYGSEEQKLEHLPEIARGRRFFAVAMSEPDTGSDLASVRTTAERTDAGWRLAGTKVWISGAHVASHCVVLARTAPRSEADRHGGLSQFIVPLDLDGVTVRPIRLLSGEHHFNEVVFDGALLGDDALLGVAGQGWAQVVGELVFERSGPERFLSTFPLLTASIAELRDRRMTGEDAVGVGSLLARIWTLRQMSLDVAAALAAGGTPSTEAALVKDMGTRFEGDSVETLRRLLGSEAEPGSAREVDRLLVEAVQHAPSFTLRGGTNEILRGIVAREIGVRR